MNVIKALGKRYYQISRFILIISLGAVLLSAGRMILLRQGDRYYKQKNFQKAYEYYSHSSREMTDLMEKTHPLIAQADGSVILFGQYEQDGNEDNGREPIEWTILTKEDNKALLISKKILECRPFESSSDDSPGWHFSELRDWMNEEFYYIAFSQEEQKSIKPYNSKLRKYQMNDYKDDVFLLGLIRMEQIYNISYDAVGDVSRARSEVEGIQTEYVEQKYPENKGRWWVDNSFHDGYGLLMNGDGSLGDGDCRDANIGVRPMIWVEQ